MQVLQEIRVEVPDLGAKIKEARLAKKYSMRKAAKLAGVSQPTWWGFEKEEHGIKLETLRRIEQVLEIQLLSEDVAIPLTTNR